MKSLRTRFRSSSDTGSQPTTYFTASQIFDRCLSAPNLGKPEDISNRELASIMARLWLEEGPAKFASIKTFPPDYKTLAPIVPRFPILPREEEGKEKLPGYTPSIFKQGLLIRKQELNSPFLPSPQRHWHAVHVELNNTQLNVFAALKYNHIEEHKKSKYAIGKLLRSYTLQYADVGVANDYTKKPYVIRLRVESEQFLLECSSQEDCIVWINVLQMAIDLALPLEERKLPKYRSIPRRTRRRIRPESRNSTSNGRPSTSSAVGITRGHSTIRISTPTPPEPRITRRRPQSTIELNPASNRSNKPSTHGHPLKSITKFFHSLAHHGHVDPDFVHIHNKQADTNSLAPMDSIQSIGASLYPISSTRTSISRINSRNNISARTEAEDDTDEEESGDEDDAARLGIDQSFNLGNDITSNNDEKWIPKFNQPTYAHFVRYAQRCLASLPAKTSWVNKTIILNGKKFIVRESCYEKVLVMK